jgi:hypothetical protein
VLFFAERFRTGKIFFSAGCTFVDHVMFLAREKTRVVLLFLFQEGSFGAKSFFRHHPVMNIRRLIKIKNNLTHDHYSHTKFTCVVYGKQYNTPGWMIFLGSRL